MEFKLSNLKLKELINVYSQIEDFIKYLDSEYKANEKLEDKE